MTYPTFVTLKLVALILSAIYLATHLPGALFPERFARFVKPLPRNYWLGVVLVALATIWFVLLTTLTDLGELTSWRNGLISAWLAAGLLTCVFVPVFLTARGLGALLLLSATPMLDSAFLVETPFRYVVTLLAYAWVIKGMLLVYHPYLLRDALDFLTKTPQRCRLLCGAGAAFGLVLFILAVTVYP